MTKVNLEVSIYHNDDGEDSNGPYSYRGTTSGSVDRVYIANSDYDFGYRGMETDLDPPFHVVYAEYMTGDTFGSDYEACIVGIVRTDEEALALLDEAETAKEFGSLSNGFHVPWLGYFEHLLGLHSTEVYNNSRRHRRY